MFFYFAYQLRISSDIELPELIVWPNGKHDEADVQIIEGCIDNQKKAQLSQAGPFSYADENNLLLEVPDIASYLVTEGNTVVYQQRGKSKEQDIRVFLLGSCFGALLIQRNFLTLHGNAFQYGDHSVICVGRSTFGKSTLAAKLMQLGYSILSDDVCAINDKNQVIPSYPRIKLNRDVAQNLSIDVSKLHLIRDNLDSKYSMPLEEAYCDQVLPVKAIYELNPYTGNEISFSSINQLERFTTLKKNTYRPRYVESMQKSTKNFKQYCNLAQSAHMARVERPIDHFCVNELAERLIQDLEKIN